MSCRRSRRVLPEIPAILPDPRRVTLGIPELTWDPRRVTLGIPELTWDPRRRTAEIGEITLGLGLVVTVLDERDSGISLARLESSVRSYEAPLGTHQSRADGMAGNHSPALRRRA
ncbi:MAG: hypothetical protein E4H01_13410 [Lysobacterales bacterium]|nr:MAG: hypothetical protein E4H01_13410 [Xanthomonadales bacterium]